LKNRPENDTVPVRVDADFARIGSKAYAINKINSVDVSARRPHSRDPAIVWCGLALICAVVAANGSSSIWWVLCAASAALAYRAWERFKVVEYFLMLTTSSAEIAAIKSREPDFIDSLRTQIETAMIERAS
jgi:hypothetical protein